LLCSIQLKPIIKKLLNCDRWSLASHFQENGARQLFPCWDEPHLKAMFNISIRLHHNFKILSNMLSQNQIWSDINDFTWSHYYTTILYTTPPMSTFQIVIVITNYPSMCINKDICLWCEKCSKYNQTLKFEFAKNVIENITLYL